MLTKPNKAWVSCNFRIWEVEARDQCEFKASLHNTMSPVSKTKTKQQSLNTNQLVFYLMNVLILIPTIKNYTNILYDYFSPFLATTDTVFSYSHIFGYFFSIIQQTFIEHQLPITDRNVRREC